MPKGIIVCCDGTSNTAYKSNDASPLTNVVRISRCIKPVTAGGMPQIVFYQPGLGTESVNISIKLWNRAWGIGIDEKIMEAYNFICLNYKRPGGNLDENADEIVLLGFSRGAFAIKCLADLIGKAGLLTRAGLMRLPEMYSLWSKGGTNFDNFQTRTAISIKVCGLWDTVNSTGSLEFVGSLQPSHIEHSFQALSLHEHRRPFVPIILQRPNNPPPPFQLQQCWFTGYHADIGGGQNDEALAHFALAWMMSRIGNFVSLDFDHFWRNEARSSGWRVRRRTPDHQELRVEVPDSLMSYYHLAGSVHRQPVRNYNPPHRILTQGESCESIHKSVYQLTFPGGEHPPAFPPCRALSGIRVQDLQMSQDNRKTWPLQYDEAKNTRARRPNRPDIVRYSVEEAEHTDLERVLTTIWVRQTLREQQDNAQIGDADPGGNFIVALHNALETQYVDEMVDAIGAHVAIVNKTKNKEVLEIPGEYVCKELSEKFTQRKYVRILDSMVHLELREDETAHAPAYINVDSQTSLIIARGMNMEGFSPLFPVVRGGDLDGVRKLLELGIDAELRDIDGLTPLSYAARNGRTDIVLELLKEKIYIDAKDWDGATALSWAVRHGHDNTVNFLVYSGAGIYVQIVLLIFRY
ncbi:hypothetical protein SCARD494_08824 [Seiridium cardinale]